MSKSALITGITGQDGSYLAELLIEKGYEVHGVIRRTSMFNRQRIDDARGKATASGRVYELHYGDMGDSSSLNRIIAMTRPDEIYNLAAQSFVGTSWTQPVLTGEFTGLGVTRMLEAMKKAAPNALAISKETLAPLDAKEREMLMGLLSKLR